MRDDHPDMKATTPGMARPTDPPTDPQPAVVRIEFKLDEILSDMKHVRLWTLRAEAKRPWYPTVMKLQAVHYVALVCASLAAGLPQLEAAFPPGATPYIKGSAAVFVLLASVLGVLSPSVTPPALAAKSS